MLTDRLCQLLTAYVDGELSTRQRKAVQRLLQRSSEARDLYDKLKRDSNILHLLPRTKLDQDLSQTVIETILSRGLRPVRPVPAASMSRLSALAGLATAAAVLVAVGAASYVYFASSYSGTSHHVASRSKTPSPGGGPALAPDTRQDPDAVAVQQPNPDAPPTPEKAPTPAPVVKNEGRYISTPPYGPELPSQEGVKPRDPLGTAPLDPKKMDIPVVKSSLLFLPLRELDQPPQLKKLQDYLQKDNSFRLHQICLDTGKALDRLQAALKEQGINLRIDPEVPARLKQRTRTSLALYAEDLTRDELAKILQKLGSDDKAVAAKNSKDGQFVVEAVVKSLNDKDRAELGKLLGVNPVQLQPAKGTPEPGKPSAGKPNERSALVAAYPTSSSAPVRPASREVKQFLDSRKAARAGSVQVFLVLQGQNN